VDDAVFVESDPRGWPSRPAPMDEVQGSNCDSTREFAGSADEIVEEEEEVMGDETVSVTYEMGAYLCRISGPQCHERAIRHLCDQAWFDLLKCGNGAMKASSVDLQAPTADAGLEDEDGCDGGQDFEGTSEPACDVDTVPYEPDFDYDPCRKNRRKISACALRRHVGRWFEGIRNSGDYRRCIAISLILHIKGRGAPIGYKDFQDLPFTQSEVHQFKGMLRKMGIMGMDSGKRKKDEVLLSAYGERICHRLATLAREGADHITLARITRARVAEVKRSMVAVARKSKA